MKWRLFRRRLTVSSPTVAVRSAVPWPLRWLGVAMVLGFCGALGLWAFEFGKDIAGLDRNAKEELEQLRVEVTQLKQSLADSRKVSNTSESLLLTERTAQQTLLAQIKQLEQDNQALRNDLGFFQRLSSSNTGKDGLNIRGIQVEKMATQVRWQVLLIQAEKNAPEFSGQLEIILNGTLNGKTWSMVHGTKPMTIKLQTYLRQEGVSDLPQGVILKSITAKVTQGNLTKSTLTQSL